MILRLFFVRLKFEFSVIKRIINLIFLLKNMISSVNWGRFIVILYKILWINFLFWELFWDWLKMFRWRLGFLNNLRRYFLPVVIHYWRLSVDAIIFLYLIFQIFVLIYWSNCSFNKFLDSFLDVSCQNRNHLLVELIIGTEFFSKQIRIIINVGFDNLYFSIIKLNF